MLSSGKIGECELLYRDGEYYLAISISSDDVPIVPINGAIGVDLGITEIATDSLGNQYSGEQVKSVRRKVRRIRALLQSKGTKSAKRHLCKIRNKQSRFVRDVNHCISKKIVQTVLFARKALGLENLKGIRDRGNGFNREMRWLLGGWSFYDLGFKIEYKAQDVGIPVVMVDPAYTSQTCPKCGHCERANRKSQSVFKCVKCGFNINADLAGALNIGTRAENLMVTLGLLPSVCQPVY